MVSFWVFPVISALMWLGTCFHRISDSDRFRTILGECGELINCFFLAAMLLAMIGSWGADGAHPLSDMNGGKNRTIPLVTTMHFSTSSVALIRSIALFPILVQRP